MHEGLSLVRSMSLEAPRSLLFLLPEGFDEIEKRIRINQADATNPVPIAQAHRFNAPIC
jgi:hypothetical protein